MALVGDVAINVLMEAPECPTSVAEHAIIRSTRELCRRARCWRVDIPWSDYLAGTEVNDLADILDQLNPTAVLFGNTDGVAYRPVLSDILGITSVFQGNKVTPMTILQLDETFPRWRDETTSSVPRYWARDTGGIYDSSSEVLSGFYFYPRPTGNSNARAIADGATNSTAVTNALLPLITIADGEEDHVFNVGDRVRLTGWGSLISTDATDQAVWRSLNNRVVRISTVPDRRSFRIDGPDISTFGANAGWAGVSFSAGSTPRVIHVDYDIRAAVIPKQGAETKAIPDYLLRFHEETIIAGALAYVLRMPEAPWQNLRQSQGYGAYYERGIMDATATAEDEHTTGVRRKVRYGGL